MLNGGIHMNNKIIFSNSDTNISVTNNKTSSTSYRTKAKSGVNSDIRYPNKVAIPTYQPYQYATSLFPDGLAYLQPGINTDVLKFQDGKLFFEDPSGIMRKVSEAELITNFRTQEPITKINGLHILRVYYSIILENYIDAIKKKLPLPTIIKLYVPDLAEYLGYDREINPETIKGIIAKMMSFHNVIGVMRSTRNDKVYKSFYPIFFFSGYDEKTNTIEIYSPYVHKVIETIYEEAIKRDAKTYLPKLNQKGEPIRLPSHSFLIKPSIGNEKNLAAIENVMIIVQLIEQSGNYPANIKVSTIIERNPQFKYRLDESNSKHKTQLLQRIFKRTWELLRTETTLIDAYKNIQLPDPNNPANIPTMKTLDMVFTFPHEGKLKNCKFLL